MAFTGTIIFSEFFLFLSQQFFKNERIKWKKGWIHEKLNGSYKKPYILKMKVLLIDCNIKILHSVSFISILIQLIL